ncbi:SPFH domain-containing protein [Candidatus Woesearchaeota archaeon]|jgi:regulator of protease activity HflC (stomatin/prohibitin superfamily)|nr:SPFH domain-containing protein [Candidatus Woesearchaeota archaeon]MBT6519069.1 SPFH domain-containing protein [Candidatus Woesearchaeota archaeon]MBT7366867.1 SPFH domain-containing protein [Candidatus Woesearchaeota archaeon]
MLGLNYFKAEPSDYVRKVVKGKVVKEGKGISGFYMPFRTNIEVVSTASIDTPFVFKEISNDNQEVTIQGGFVYKIEQPDLTLEEYNLSINPKTKEYSSDGKEKLAQHLIQLVRSESRALVQSSKLEDLIVGSDNFSETISDKLSSSTEVSLRGVKLSLLYIESILPKPEISKALEAEYREQLLQKQDEEIYKRRANAVENERTIRENEMQTEIKIEEDKKELVKLQSENLKDEAKAKAEAAKLELGAFEGLSSDSIRAHALYQLGKNADRIENLTITPELLAGLKSTR